jgi:molybdopterin-guanine dinucleotide biosynthesis protein A
LEKSAIILAGGFSTRLGQDKGLVQLGGRPLVQYVLDKACSLVDETLIIVNSQSQTQTYRKALRTDAVIVSDDSKIHGPLVGASAGFRLASGKYSLLLSCDTPFVSEEILQLLLELCVNKNATIPRWPNCYIEPLQAAYHTEFALRAADEALASGELKMQAMVNRLRNIRYVSTLVLEQLDSSLHTFFNVNTILDLRKAENILKSTRTRTKGIHP